MDDSTSPASQFSWQQEYSSQCDDGSSFTLDYPQQSYWQNPYSPSDIINNCKTYKLQQLSNVSLDSSSNKKLDHNANERERRKKVNALYNQLGSLIPTPRPKGKMSIPAIVSVAVKYIPLLRNQITLLQRRKEEIIESHNNRIGLSLKSIIDVDVNVSLCSITSHIIIKVQTPYSARHLFPLLIVFLLEDHRVPDLLQASLFVSFHRAWHIIHVDHDISLQTRDVKEKVVRFLVNNYSSQDAQSKDKDAINFQNLPPVPRFWDTKGIGL